MGPQTYCRHGCAAPLAEQGAGYDAMQRASWRNCDMMSRGPAGRRWPRPPPRSRGTGADGPEAPADGEAGRDAGAGVSSRPAPTS